MSKSGERTQSVKIVLIMLGITVWSLAILVRLVQLQVFRYDNYTQSAIKKQKDTQSVPAPRGIIYDSHMDELASNVSVKTVRATPRLIENKPETARKIASILQMDSQKLLDRMSDPAHEKFLQIKRRIDPNAEKRIRNLGLAGIYFIKESMRVYPNREQACHILGFMNMNGDPGGGVESTYDKVLKGEDGLYTFDVDAHDQAYGVHIEKPPIQGNSLVLSVDRTIQHIADREIQAAVEKANAKAGTVIVLESDTGRILALSNYPQFNPNTYTDYDKTVWAKNRAVADIYEPGSTFKVVVAASALDAGLTHPGSMIDCQNGAILLGGHVFRDHEPYGMLTFTDVLVHSSNVGAIKLGLKLGNLRLYESLLNFGFGTTTDVDLPGEIVGLVRKPQDWSGLSIGSISFGQEVGVTSIQMATAINAIANGGYRVRPYVVDRVIDKDQNTIRENRPELIQIISPRTAEAVTEAFEGVVLRGTGRRAALEGYRAAGKTGTAQKSVNGRYPNGVYVSSFIGFAPLPHPKVTILVQLDEPRNGYYGGDVCAPYFKNIAQEVLLQLRVPPDTDITLPEIGPSNIAGESRDFVPNAAPALPLSDPDEAEPVENNPNVVAIQIESEWVVMPNFLGLSKRSVMDRCIDLGIYLKSAGSGVAVFQSPAPGTEIPVGTSCKVTFAKSELKDLVAAVKDPSKAVEMASSSPF